MDYFKNEYKGNCNTCQYYNYDYSTGTSDCDQFDNMTEEEIEKHYTNDAPNCPCYKHYYNRY